MSEYGRQFESVLEDFDRFNRLPWWSFECLEVRPGRILDRGEYDS